MITGKAEPAELEPGRLETDAVAVRTLALADVAAVGAIDEKITGRSRRDYMRRRIDRALGDAGVSLSLAAEVDGRVVGFLLAAVDYGEFGVMEPVAVLDTIGVHPDFRGRHVARALVRQLALNLTALRIDRLKTEVDWRQWDLIRFLETCGFAPAPRLCLEAEVEGLPR